MIWLLLSATLVAEPPAAPSTGSFSYRDTVRTYDAKGKVKVYQAKEDTLPKWPKARIVRTDEYGMLVICCDAGGQEITVNPLDVAREAPPCLNVANRHDNTHTAGSVDHGFTGPGCRTTR